MVRQIGSLVMFPILSLNYDFGGTTTRHGPCLRSIARLMEVPQTEKLEKFLLSQYIVVDSWLLLTAA